MKSITLYGLLICSATILINSGCTEETLATGSPTYTAPPTNTPPTTENIKLNVSAGDDIQVVLSYDSRFLILSGDYVARGIQGEIIKLTNVKIQWEKKSGPSSYTLEDPHSIKTKVSDLEKGIYEFELTVTNDNGLTVKDRVRLTVGSISDIPKEIIFENKIWLPIWYFNIKIDDFKLLIPQNNFKIYIQRENNPQWEEVTPMSQNLANGYEYFIESRPDGAGMYHYGSLYIFHYGNETDDTPSVKIVF